MLDKCFKIRLKQFPGKLNQMTKKWEMGDRRKPHGVSQEPPHLNKREPRKWMGEIPKKSYKKISRNKHEFLDSTVPRSTNHDI